MEFITFNKKVINNYIQIIPEGGVLDNSIYEITFKNVKGEDNKILNTEKRIIYTKVNPSYASIDTIKTLLADYDIDDSFILQNIREASKLADYYADIKLNSKIKNALYYSQVGYAQEFEKEQFVRYMVAKICMCKIRADFSISGGVKSTLGEVSMEIASKKNDFETIINDYTAQCEKWKKALQGYKDHEVDSKSVVKSSINTTYTKDSGSNLRSDLNFVRPKNY